MLRINSSSPVTWSLYLLLVLFFLWMSLFGTSNHPAARHLPARDASSSVPSPPPPSIWKEAIDQSSGNRYFYNSITGLSQWENPFRVSEEVREVKKPDNHINRVDQPLQKTNIKSYTAEESTPPSSSWLLQRGIQSLSNAEAEKHWLDNVATNTWGPSPSLVEFSKLCGIFGPNEAERTLRKMLNEAAAAVHGAVFPVQNLPAETCLPSSLTDSVIRPHVIIERGSLPRAAAAAAIIRLLMQVERGGLVLADNLSGDYVSSNGWPWESNNWRYSALNFTKQSLNPSIRPFSGTPSGALAVVSDYFHEKKDSDCNTFEEKGLFWLVHRELESIDCWFNICSIRRKGGSTPINAEEAKSSFGKQSWLEVVKAQPWQTDKVTTHNYAPAYNLYLAPYRALKRVRMLEIGLGCGMPYGEGKSEPTWRNYFGDVLELTFLEFDAKCANAWMAQPRDGVLHMYTGDQRDEILLRRIIKERGPFDVIVDDGGHSMGMQVASLTVLFREGLSPGGAYFLEDLLTSHWLPLSAYAHDIGPGQPYGGSFTVGYLHDIRDLLVAGPALMQSPQLRVASKGSLPVTFDAAYRQEQLEIALMTRNMDCFSEICVLVKKIIA